VVADHYQTVHHTIDIEQHRLTPEAVLDLLRHFDQPFADTACIPTYWVSQAMADQGIKCALSGDGGDEAFGGYSRFWRAHRLMQLMRAPAWVRTAAEQGGRMLSHYTRDVGRQIQKATRLAQASRNDSAVLLAGMSNYLSEDQKAELVRRDARGALETSYRHFNGRQVAAAQDIDDLSSRMTEALFAVSLPSKMLRKVDMMSMRAGVEVRVPLLDEAIVTLGCSLPHRLKTDGNNGKLIPRSLARRWLPPAVARHGKHGFDIPLDVMVPRSLHDGIRDLLTGTDSRTRVFSNQQLVGHWLEAFSAPTYHERNGTISRAGVYQRIFTLLSLELWLRDHELTW
jgi:asparagine synthase (glutamine-hydrolysing)